MGVVVAAGAAAWALPPAGGLPPEPPSLTVHELRSAPPIGKRLVLAGVVVGSYVCPRCPRGATCKPCQAPTSILVADENDPHAETVRLGVKDPADYPRNQRLRFQIQVLGRRGSALDGTVLGLAPSDRPIGGRPNAPPDAP